MKKVFFYTVLMGVITAMYSCKEKGCTDPSAENYEDTAIKDDGSCYYAPEKTEIDIHSNPTYSLFIDGIEIAKPNGSFSAVTPYTEWDNSVMDMWSFGTYFLNEITGEIVVGVKYHFKDPHGLIQHPDISQFQPGYKLVYATLLQEDAFEVYLETADGVRYSSLHTDQTLSLFQIISSTEVNVNGEKGVKMYARFSARLSNEVDPKDIKIITDAKVVSVFL